MIVYAESNFILELAYLQEQSLSCLAVVELAEAGQIELVFPAFCFAEAVLSIVRRHKTRSAILDSFDREITELSRSNSFESLRDESIAVTRAFAESVEDERRNFDANLQRLLNTATTIPTTAEVFSKAVRAQEEIFDSLQDAIVYASVVTHLEESNDSGAKCFLNKNARDFADSRIHDKLAEHRCKLLTKFGQGLDYIRSQIPSEE